MHATHVQNRLLPAPLWSQRVPLLRALRRFQKVLVPSGGGGGGEGSFVRVVSAAAAAAAAAAAEEKMRGECERSECLRTRHTIVCCLVCFSSIASGWFFTDGRPTSHRLFWANALPVASYRPVSRRSTPRAI